MKPYLKLLRMSHWVKNLFIFAPMIFSFRLFDPTAITPAILAFISFSLTASSIYIFNDIMDIEIDRLHPRKKHRPVASGIIAIKQAFIFSATLTTAGLSAGALLGLNSVLVLIMYIMLNIAYTLKLKHIAIIDIFCIAASFVLRLFMGSFATSIALSQWIIVMTFLLAIFLALAKRRDDVIIFLNGGKTRKSVEGYNLRFIDYSMAMSAAVILVAYLMYCMSAEVTERIGSPHIYITFPFVLFGLMRYLQVTFVLEKSGCPTEIILKDFLMKLAVMGWFVTFLLLIYS